MSILCLDLDRKISLFNSFSSCKGTDFTAIREGLLRKFSSSSESVSESLRGGGGGGIRTFLSGKGGGGLSLSSLSLPGGLGEGVTALIVRRGGTGGSFLLPVTLDTDTTLSLLTRVNICGCSGINHCGCSGFSFGCSSFDSGTIFSSLETSGTFSVLLCFFTGRGGASSSAEYSWGKDSSGKAAFVST